MSHHHYDVDDVSSCSSGSSRSSSRSSSASSSRSRSSKNSKSSQVSHSNIKSGNWAMSLMKWATGAPPSKPLSLRRTKVRESEEDWPYDDSASVYRDTSYTQYAWVAPKWDDSISEIASRTSSRSSGRLRREHRSQGRPRFVPPASMHQPPHFHQGPPPPPPPFFPPPGQPCDDGAGYDGYDGGQDQFHYPPPPPPPPPPAGGFGGGAPAFVDLGAGGGAGPRGGGHPGKYDDWAD